MDSSVPEFRKHKTGPCSVHREEAPDEIWSPEEGKAVSHRVILSGSSDVHFRWRSRSLNRQSQSP